MSITDRHSSAGPASTVPTGPKMPAAYTNTNGDVPYRSSKALHICSAPRGLDVSAATQVASISSAVRLPTASARASVERLASRTRNPTWPSSRPTSSPMPPRSPYDDGRPARRHSSSLRLVRQGARRTGASGGAQPSASSRRRATRIPAYPLLMCETIRRGVTSTSSIS